LRLGEPARLRPRIDPRGLEVGIVHLGLGAFHRAHQAVFTEDALAAEPGPWGICGVARRRRHVVDALRAQDGLYTVLSRGPREDDARVIGVIREALLAAEEPDRVARRLTARSTRIVTLTVTEAGYGQEPHGPAGRLALALEARRAAGIDTPLAVLSCDNLPRNGEVLKRAVRGCCAPPLLDWIEEHVTFPSTVVDRIVPAASPPDREDARRLIGAEDQAPVVAEPYYRWIVEDRFHGPRPAWEHAGAQLVDDTSPYELLKLRVVNASHSALAYLGLPAGHQTVADAIADPALEAFVRRLLEDELVPTLPPLPHTNVGAYVEETLARFANPRLGHRLDQIAAGGGVKLSGRLLAPARELLDGGREPAGIARVVAAWLSRADADPEVLGGELRESATFRALLDEARSQVAV
jgi:fructuronate reductase